MEQLKPCPFCGSKVTMTYNSYSNTFNVYHDREACALYEPILIDGYLVKSLSEAAKAWNRRANDALGQEAPAD